MTSKEFMLKGLKKGLKKFQGVNIENLFRLENLKLHDACYLCESEEDYELFNMFCCMEYDFFEKYILKENFVEPVQYNRTSSHFFKNDTASYDIYDLEELMYSTYDEKLEFIFNDFIYNYFNDNFYINLKNGEITFQEDYINEEYIKENYIIDSIFDYFDKDIEKDAERYIKENITNVNNVFEYIDNFQKNQVENFKDFLENNK